jgi:N-methylhydantoinase B/oxoprolinase/acetone carboxylase alpha subunit
MLLDELYHGGIPLNDVTVVSRVLLDGECPIFPAGREHRTEVGGMMPGSYGGLSTDR